MNIPIARVSLLIGAGAAVSCLGFTAFTGHAREVYSIRFRSGLNLATGYLEFDGVYPVFHCVSIVP